MHVFIDDSGDGGVKFGQGSTDHLVMGAAVFDDPKQIEALADALKQCATRASHRREFRYTKTSEKVRDRFFDAIKPVSFHVRAIIIEKRVIRSEKLRSSPPALKSYAIRQLLTKNYGTIRGAKIIIDGEDSKAFGVQDDLYLRRMVNRESPGTIASVRFADSKQNIGVQLADMLAGAIRRAEHERTPKGQRHLDTFRSRTWQPRGSYWNFK